MRCRILAFRKEEKMALPFEEKRYRTLRKRRQKKQKWGKNENKEIIMRLCVGKKWLTMGSANGQKNISKNWERVQQK
jgi:hypothetical protein